MWKTHSSVWSTREKRLRDMGDSGVTGIPQSQMSQDIWLSGMPATPESPMSPWEKRLHPQGATAADADRTRATEVSKLVHFEVEVSTLFLWNKKSRLFTWKVPMPFMSTEDTTSSCYAACSFAVEGWLVVTNPHDGVAKLFDRTQYNGCTDREVGTKRSKRARPFLGITEDNLETGCHVHDI